MYLITSQTDMLGELETYAFTSEKNAFDKFDELKQNLIEYGVSEVFEDVSFDAYTEFYVEMENGTYHRLELTELTFDI